jgi:hypothetical protein
MATTETVTRQPNGKFAVEAGLAEFNALRAEINSRMTAQAALVGVGLTGLGVIVGLVVKEHGDHRLLLAVPPLAVSVNFLWAVENRQVGLIGEYIRTLLWPYLARTDKELPSWEDECAKRRRGVTNILRSIFTDFAMTMVFAGAAITSLLILGERVNVDGHRVKVSFGLRLFDWVLAILALVVPFAMTIGNWRRTEKES